MSKNNLQKKIYRALSLVSFLMLSLQPGLTAIAQVSSQIGSLTVTLSDVIYLDPPDNFSFDQTFIEPGSTNTITTYKTLSPLNASEIMKVIDTDIDNSFKVDISLSDLISTTNVTDKIHYTDISLVTLSNSLSDPVDIGSMNIPPTTNSIAALDCNWDPQNQNYPKMQDYCEPSMLSFTEPACTLICPAPMSNEMTILENLNPLETGEFSLGFGLKLNLTNVNPGNYEGTLTISLTST